MQEFIHRNGTPVIFSEIYKYPLTNNVGVPILPCFGVGNYMEIKTIHPDVIVDAIKRTLDYYSEQIIFCEKKTYTWKIKLQSKNIDLESINPEVCCLTINIFYDKKNSLYILDLINTYGNFLKYHDFSQKLQKEINFYKFRENYLRLTEGLVYEDDNHILKWLLNDFIKKEICTWIS